MSRIETIKRKLFKFEELTKQEQQNCLDKNRTYLVDDMGWFNEYDVREIANILGIEIKHIYFDVNYVQGAGACFEGTYQYNKNSLKAIKQYAPSDFELHSIVKELNRLQRKNFYKLKAYVKHNGRYYHENCTDIDIYKDGNYFFDTRDSYVRGNLEDGALLCVALRDFMKWIFKQARNEYDYLQSDDCLSDYFIDNDFEFLEDGSKY